LSSSAHFIINILHQISANSPSLNDFMNLVSNNDFLASGVLVCILLFFWFQHDQDRVEKRKLIINTLISCLIAIAVGRLLTRILPFQVRPVLDPKLSYLYPFQHIADSMNTSNSMPSDHAVLYTALATGIFLISKKIGLLTFLYVFGIGLFSRVYLGYHYPSDIFVGSIVGILITLIYSHISIKNQINQRVLKFSTNYSGIFYVLFFLLNFEIATMFKSSRDILHYAATCIFHIQ